MSITFVDVTFELAPSNVGCWPPSIFGLSGACAGHAEWFLPIVNDWD